MQQASRFAGDKPEADLRKSVLDLAMRFDVPVTKDNFFIRRDDDHTYISGSYTRSIDFLPRLGYPWLFSWRTDSFTIPGAAASRPADR